MFILSEEVNVKVCLESFCLFALCNWSFGIIILDRKIRFSVRHFGHTDDVALCIKPRGRELVNAEHKSTACQRFRQTWNVWVWEETRSVRYVYKIILLFAWNVHSLRHSESSFECLSVTKFRVKPLPYTLTEFAPL